MCVILKYTRSFHLSSCLKEKYSSLGDASHGWKPDLVNTFGAFAFLFLKPGKKLKSTLIPLSISGIWETPIYFFV